jgi:DNA helicase-2/ATP-dependent DNA helicase PcrA
LILAGAGSGKTRVIAYRLTELLRRGVDPERILSVTFTNKAAGELRSRVEELGSRFGLIRGGDDYRGARGLPRWLGTFHSIGARLLRRLADRAGLPADFVILDDDDQLKLLKEICQEEQIEETAMPPRLLRSLIDRAKNRGQLPEHYKGHDYLTDLVARLYPIYQQRLQRLGGADFGDLLLWPVVLCDRDPALAELLGRRFAHVLVDEFQDVNQVQYRLLRHLAGSSRNLVVVGDDDQAIYGWRGADVQLILDFAHDWPEVQVVKLEENYRSTQVILDAAHAVVARNPLRHDKKLYTQRAGGERIICYEALDERREALYVANTILLLSHEHGYLPADFAVIYRTNAQSRVLEEALRACDLPYTVVGGARFYDRAEVKDILAYLRLCNNPADELALRRVVNVPARGIGDKSVSKLEAQARLSGQTLWATLQAALDDEALLPAATRKKLRSFTELIGGLRRAAGELTVTQLAREVLTRTGYLSRFRADDAEDQSRHENILELIGSIEQLERERVHESASSLTPQPLLSDSGDEDLFDEGPLRPLTLSDYLTRVALASGDDGEGGQRGAQLMTAHAAKGLEFKVVLVTGLEEGLFPSQRTGADSEAERDSRMQEERRLCYVALTRARERLFLTHAQQRRLFGGQPKIAPASRFIGEIPPSCMDRSVEYERPSSSSGRRPGLAWSGQRPRPPAAVGDEYSQAEPAARRPLFGDPGEPRIEYDSDEVHGPLRVGQPVRHLQLGPGHIESVTAWHHTVTVRFDSGLLRTLDPRYLQLLSGGAVDG